MANLCIDCDNAVPDNRGHGCPWSRSFEPVEGWVAPVRYLPNGTKGPTKTYNVKECPLFIPSRCPEFAKKAAKVSRVQPVRCVETGEVYATMRAAAEWVGSNPSGIGKAVSDGRTCKGYHWEKVSTEK